VVPGTTVTGLFGIGALFETEAYFKGSLSDSG